MILRNSYWAAQIPDRGRGVVYGGNDHFADGTYRPNASVQGFLRARGFKDFAMIRNLDDLGLKVEPHEYDDIADPPAGFFDDR